VSVNANLDVVPADEELEEYRLRAREWLGQNMPRLDRPGVDPEQGAERLRMLIRRLWDGGYAGICFPTELGGAGLSRYHHRAFLEEALSYELPIHVGNPGLSIIAPPIMEFGTTEQKRHVTAMLNGDEIYVQMMSEPTGGSDMAGALSRAERDGDVWVLNGSKIWSSGAYRSTWGLVLVRTDWSVPKHRGLSMILLDLSLPGVEVHKIRMVNGAEEFCQEFFTDVQVPADCLLGEPNDGWTVATRLLVHERDAVGGSSPYAFTRPSSTRTASSADLAQLARRLGRGDDPAVAELVGEAHTDEVVGRQLIERVTEGISLGAYPPVAGSLLRLNIGVQTVRRASIGLEIAGVDGVTWEEGDPGPHAGDQFVFRQASCIGGGTTEMQRNLISERVMGMPREPAADRDRPFSEVRRGPGA
jgi:alkylation response protein AidB-like acyl-CoA dehydrogenase